MQKDGTAALAAYVEPGATVMRVGVLNAETDMCWVTYEVQAAVLQDMAGEPAVANRDCEVRVTTAEAEVVAAALIGLGV